MTEQTPNEKLKALKAERDGLASAILKAAESGNSEELLRLKARQAELPAEIFGATVDVHTETINKLEAQKAEATARKDAAEKTFREQAPELEARIKTLQKQIEETGAEFNQKRMLMESEQHQLVSLTTEIHDARQRLRAFVQSETGTHAQPARA